ncbi:Armadillo [Cynara cardunculus var. scolymus]|uniref:Armadillo n=1 Tax=Cynara cardunculus var. scolymus TaxID=59895 RepID=A0A103Y7I6_CYNCS|nr:Armadillo [Cynara cardunculus var. scolymus]
MENQKRHEQPTNSVRRSLKRKLEDEFIVDRKITSSDDAAQQDLVSEVRAQVEILDSTFSSAEADRALVKRSIHILSELAKNEDIVNLIVESGAVPALVRHLQAPQSKEVLEGPRPYEHEVEKGSAFTLGLLAIKPEHQQLIVAAGALPHLVALLKRHRDGQNSRAVNGVIRRAADAITNLAHENSSIKTRALRTLAFKNDENKTQIVDCNALPTLILMLRSEDAAIHYEAVGVIGNLVHSSPNIKKEVLLAGALQPVIELLSSTCSESQREAALLLGQFAAADTDCKVHIVQRGAVGPLIEMLQSPDAQLREMSAFALGRLAQVVNLLVIYMFVHDIVGLSLTWIPSYAYDFCFSAGRMFLIYQDTHNQAGIAHGGGILPLLKLLDSRNGSLQHNAAFALYGLADNEDNVADLIRVGGVQKLQDGEFIVQPTRDCVAKTLKRLEEKIHGRVLSHLLYLMRIAERSVQRRVALALAHLCSPDDQKTIFVDGNDSCVALCKLAEKASSLSPVDAGPPSPISQVYLGEQYVNNPTLSDVTFLIEGKRFYAHRICLLASSDAFRAMFDGGYREKDAKDIEIPNIRWDVFELMMRYGSLIQRVLPEMRNYFVRTLARPVEADMRQ